jgi:hypothetical protein
MGTIKSENCNVATMELDNRRRLILLQTLRTRDFDELAGAFPRWDLRFRQFGRGPFRSQLQFHQLGGIRIFGSFLCRDSASCRKVHGPCELSLK